MRNNRKRKNGMNFMAVLLLNVLSIVLMVVVLGMGMFMDADSSLPEHRRMYLQLTNEEKEVYMVAKNHLQQGNESFEVCFNGYEKDEVWKLIERAMQALYYDYPEFYWWNQEIEGKYVDDGSQNVNYEITFQFYDFWEKAEQAQFEQALKEKVNEITAQADAYSDEYEKVKYVHDYLVKNVIYDQDAANEKYQNDEIDLNEQAHTAYGALVNGKAVHDGYAKCFQLLVNMLDIECEFVQGTANGDIHSWNYIKLDGEYYWVDVMFDDSESGENPEAVKYDYLCCTSQKLQETHFPKTDFTIPECTSEKYI